MCIRTRLNNSRPFFTKLYILLLTISILLITTSNVIGEIYISDHFDDQPDWDGSGDNPSPWSNWLTVSGSTKDISGDWDDAHGSDGKSFRITWPDQILEVGLATYVASSKPEIWVGFRWRHSSGFDMGPDNQDKWIYFPEAGGERNMISHKENTLAFFNGSSYSCKVNIGTDSDEHPNTSLSAWYNDTDWHSYIMYISPSNDTVRIWRDGTELGWDSDNTNIGFNGTSFDSSEGMVFGYQSRNGWAGHYSYFDDIIIASTKAEVESFLGVDNGDQSNNAPIANAGDDQTLLDTDGDGTESVVLNGSGSSDSDGYIASYEWREGGTLLASGSTAIATLNMGIGSHNITLEVADDSGNSVSDSVLININSESSSPSAETLLVEESFDSNELSNNGWYDLSSTQTVVFDSLKDSNVLEIAYKSGQTTAVNGSMRRLFNETDEMYFSYDVRYQTGWSWTGQNYGPHEFNFLTNLESHNYKGPALTHCTTYVEMVNGIPRIGFQDGLNIDGSNIGQDLTNVTENRGVFGCNGDSDGYPSASCYESDGSYYNGKHWAVNMSPINSNQWYHIETYIKMNSISNNKGVNNGILKMWVNGELKLSYDNILIRTNENANMKFNQLLLGPYFHGGAPHDQKFWLDNILVKTGVSIPSNPGPPDTVTGVEVIDISSP